MKFFQTKEWPIFDLGALKTSTACFALILGAYFSNVIQQYAIWIGGLGFLCVGRMSFIFIFLRKADRGLKVA